MRSLLMALGIFLLCAPAHAHVFIEPDLGFEFGTDKQSFTYTDGTAGSTSSSSQNGASYGLTGGYRHQRYFVGAQYEKGMGGHITDISANFGMWIALRIRVWGSYIFSAKDEVAKGSGYKAGMGFTLTKLFNLNFEYAARSYNQYTATTAPTLTYSGTTNSFKVFFSVPIPRFGNL
ncbi:MAG: hypothetical protein ACXVB9_09825 [Bdellovibrionota bacterium]